MTLTREEGWTHLCAWTDSEALRRHARAVEIAMRAAAHRYGAGAEEEESWGLVWDERYAGRLSMIDSLIDGVMVAAIYIGAKDPYNMTPDEYRERWGLASDYPMVAPNYAKQRSELAKAIGLGTRPRQVAYSIIAPSRTPYRT